MNNTSSYNTPSLPIEVLPSTLARHCVETQILSSPQSDLPFHKSVFAGAVAGLVEVLIMYPLDVVKTRMQLRVGAERKSIVGIFSTIIKEEGAGRLYRGILSPILAEAPKRAIKFSTNEKYKEWFTNKKTHKLSYTGAATAGALAGTTEAFANCPFEVVKVRMQAKENAGIYKTVFDAATKIAQQEGVMTLYRGFESQVWRNAVWNGAYFACIPIVKANLWKPQDKKSELLLNFTAGFIGGTLGTTLNTPFDVVKSRNQNLRGTPEWAIISLMKLYREEGFVAMYKGYVPRILRLGPGGGIMLLAFDLIAQWIR